MGHRMRQPVTTRVNELLEAVKDGDVRRVQVVFSSRKAICVACHAIGYVGGKVGPDLTKIGQIRTERDLLEAIVLPSASFVRSYEPIQVVTTSGKVFNGLIRSETAAIRLAARLEASTAGSRRLGRQGP